ncbi:hypothetical protein HU200_034961 [Digitaria exilis]|uniref:Uncharacterized protein n=1 Tax=Digitaria exilis TaxID=1010633 RepID=A0A835BSS8_9POAL|nr:hypothetical protein HU200_034961 [Digitaria exilis]
MAQQVRPRPDQGGRSRRPRGGPRRGDQPRGEHPLPQVQEQRRAGGRGGRGEDGHRRGPRAAPRRRRGPRLPRRRSPCGAQRREAARRHRLLGRAGGARGGAGRGRRGRRAREGGAVRGRDPHAGRRRAHRREQGGRVRHAQAGAREGSPALPRRHYARRVPAVLRPRQGVRAAVPEGARPGAQRGRHRRHPPPPQAVVLGAPRPPHPR